MCGIAGIIAKHLEYVDNLSERLQHMSQTMRHRGPNDKGIFISQDSQVGFANQRLAIRDLSLDGHMPMERSDATLCITYNGEIYNSDELRAKLKKSGYVFESESDTEVILYGYAEWGREVVAKLRGMFAFAIYDNRNNKRPCVFIARDHMGIKPLYIAETSHSIIFASEISTLLASNLLTKELDATGLVGYLLMGSVPPPHTIYRNIRVLEASSYLMIDLPCNQISKSINYWSLPTAIDSTLSYDEALAKVRMLLEDVVRIRMVSDVPLGAFLSGGLDSSSVVALMRRASKGTIRTCSMAFEEQEYSEEKYAHQVADAMNTEHYERIITANDVINEFENILHFLDQPSVDGVNTYFVSQTARDAGLTVALSGLGGDELFGGYPNTFEQVPKIKQALQLIQAVPGSSWITRQVLRSMGSKRRWSRIHDALYRPATLASAYLTRRGLFSPTEVQNLVHDDIWEQALFDPVQHITQHANPQIQTMCDDFSWISQAELRTYTCQQLLRDTDVMSMAHSLEVRVPLLDIRLVEAVLQLPSAIKKRHTDIPKPLLADAMYPYLPSTIVNRTDKQGFIFPFASWLKGPLKSHVNNVLAQIVSFGIIQPSAVRELKSAYENDHLHWSRLWALVALGSVMK